MCNIITTLRDILDTEAIQRSVFNILPRLLVIIAKSRVGEKLFGGFSSRECSEPEIVPDIAVQILSSDVEVCGGFADVYFGEWRIGGVTHKIAIKLLRHFRNQEPSDLIKRLNREVTLMRKAHHPNIAEVLGTSILMGGRRAIVMPRYSDNAREYVLLHPHIDKLPIMCDILRGLLHLHSLKPQILHGDIKASNILITADGKAVIGDFGSSQMSGDAISVSTHATIRYQPPEILRESPPLLTTASDIWSLGCTLCEIWVGEFPYADRKDIAVLFVIVNTGAEPYTKPRNIVQPLEDDLWVLFRQCWDQDPDYRPSAKYIAFTLERLRAGTSPEAISVDIL